MDRETTSVVIATHTFVVKTYTTAREANAIQQALFKGSKIEMSGDTAKIGEFNTAAQFEQQQELVTQMVVSMNGESGNILERALELPSQHFDELVRALDDLKSKKKS